MAETVIDTDAVRVLLLASDEAATRSIVEACEQANIAVDWVKAMAQLLARAERDELMAPALVLIDLERLEVPAEQVIHLIRRFFPEASLVALGGDAERAVCLLGLGVPSLGRKVNPSSLAALAFQLPPRRKRHPTAVRLGEAEPAQGLGALDPAFHAYAELRALSERQQAILRLHVNGRNDKEIACSLRCAESTVYEHWRRMAKKVGGMHKADVIADFHRFLAIEPPS